MLIGYARVSTQDQDPALQLDALSETGCERVFTERASGAARDRPELKAAISYLCKGDTLVVWKLDRLARSMRQLIETVAMLEERGIGLRSLTEAIDMPIPTKAPVCNGIMPPGDSGIMGPPLLRDDPARAPRSLTDEICLTSDCFWSSRFGSFGAGAA